MLKIAEVPWCAVGVDSVPSPSALMVVHVDLTNVPSVWLAKGARHGHVINGAAATIDRRQYSLALLNQGDPHDGPVIIKTVLNHRGVPELRHALRSSWQGRLKRLAYRTIRKAEWKALTADYRVHDSISEVEADVWSDPALIVERFVPGRAQPPIVKHRWDFLEEASLVTRSVFDHPLCRPEHFREVTALHAVPAELKALRTRLNLDFGAIDYFETDDGIVPIDCNKTTTADDEWIAEYPFIGRFIAEGAEILASHARQRR